MRKHLILLALAGSAAADSKHDRIDMTDAAAKVDAYRDEAGKLYVLPKQPDHDNVRVLTFYGDGRTMYLQGIGTYSNDRGNLTLAIWAPRAKNMQNGRLERSADGKANVSCRMANSKFERKPLDRLSDEDTAKLLATARFEPIFWDRRVLFFGRGDSTTYYLVDVLREDGGGHRLFVGRKGQMKEVVVTDFTKDSGGIAIVTKGGDLLIRGDTAEWKRGKTVTAISPLEPLKNAFLIYRELGVYGRLGTICEDQ